LQQLQESKGMTEKPKKEKITALTIRMSRENLYRIKEQALEARMKLREYVHMVLGLEMNEKEEK
jgi:predicted DNA binding CopG/RHH family protein